MDMNDMAMTSVFSGQPVDNAVPADEKQCDDLQIKDTVIADLARRAALSVNGVARLAGNQLMDNLAEIMDSAKMKSRAIAVSFDDDNQVFIEIKLHVFIGERIPDVAGGVQTAVKSLVEDCSGLMVKGVRVIVSSIDDRGEENTETEPASESGDSE